MPSTSPVQPNEPLHPYREACHRAYLTFLSDIGIADDLTMLALLGAQFPYLSLEAGKRTLATWIEDTIAWIESPAPGHTRPGVAVPRALDAHTFT